MAYCKHCGMPVDEKKDRRCPRCGEFTDDRPQIAQSENNSRIIIIVLLCVLLVLCLVCLVFVVFSNKESQSHQPMYSEDVLTTIIVQNNNQYNNQYNINDVDQNQWVNSGNNSGGNNNGNGYTPPKTTAAKKVYYTFTAGYKGVINSNTPNGDGVNMRKYNDANSAKVVTLPEGTWLTYGETKTLNGDEYILCTATVNGRDYTGYVITKYILDMGQHVAGPKPDVYTTEAQTQKQEPDVNDYTGYYISYNTPENKGLVLRQEATYYSDVLVVVPEGTQVNVIDNSGKEYWGVSLYINGNYYEGYVLKKYIEYR